MSRGCAWRSRTGVVCLRKECHAEDHVNTAGTASSRSCPVEDSATASTRMDCRGCGSRAGYGCDPVDGDGRVRRHWRPVCEAAQPARRWLVLPWHDPLNPSRMIIGAVVCGSAHDSRWVPGPSLWVWPRQPRGQPPPKPRTAQHPPANPDRIDAPEQGDLPVEVQQRQPVRSSHDS